MSEHDELVKRLYDLDDRHPVGSIAIDAANAIQSLQTRVKELEADAECFRIWVREAEVSPVSVAKAIMNCITEEDYRRVLLGIRDKGAAAIKAASQP